MERGNKVSVYDENAKIPGIFSRNPRVTEILELILYQPTTKKEMEIILLNFWSKCDNFYQQEHQEEDKQMKYFCLLDVLCIFMLDYVFKRNGPTKCAVSRSLYCYLTCLNLSEENKVGFINGPKNNFVNTLRKFRNFNSAKGEDMLIDALFICLFGGNFGLLFFLLKFGLVEIPAEANGKSRKIVKKLVNKFNNILQYTFENEQLEYLRPSIEPKAILNLMRRSDINLRRSIVTFFVVVAISEFRLEFKDDKVLDKFNDKFVCLHQFFFETTESRITMKDIETFIVNCLSPLLGAEFGNTLVQFCRDIIWSYWDTLNPRSLHDLRRSTIGKTLQTSIIFPDQVNQLRIPVKLRNFLLCNCEEIFNMLRVSHHSSHIEEKIRFL